MARESRNNGDDIGGTWTPYEGEKKWPTRVDEHVDEEPVEVSSRRGIVRGPARIGDILPDHLFVSFHYGYCDENNTHYERAANELTLTAWDPVGKQPFYKNAAVQLRKTGATAAYAYRTVVRPLAA